MASSMLFKRLYELKDFTTAFECKQVVKAHTEHLKEQGFPVEPYY